MKKALVCVKRVVDHNVHVRVKSDNTGVETQNLKMSTNPFDEIALEAAIKLREAGKLDSVVAVSIGDSSSSEVLRNAIAMGADRSILIETTSSTNTTLEPLAVAKLLQKVALTEKPLLILCGKQAIDDDFGATAQMLSAMLNWSQASCAMAIEIDGETAIVHQEIDGGVRKIQTNLPSVISVDLRLNEPRYVTLPNIMKAKRKPIERIVADDIGVDVSPRLMVNRVDEIPKRPAGIRVSSTAELVSVLKSRGFTK